MQPSFKFLSIPSKWAIWTTTFLFNGEALSKLPLLTGPSQFRCHLWTCPTHQSDSKICFLGTQSILYGPSQRPCYSQTLKLPFSPTLNSWVQEHSIYKCRDWNNSFYTNNVIILKYRIRKLQGIWETNYSNRPLFSAIFKWLASNQRTEDQNPDLETLVPVLSMQTYHAALSLQTHRIKWGNLRNSLQFPPPLPSLVSFTSLWRRWRALLTITWFRTEPDLSWGVVLFSLCQNDSAF